MKMRNLGGSGGANNSGFILPQELGLDDIPGHHLDFLCQLAQLGRYFQKV